MRLPAPFVADGEHIVVDLPGARALFSTRRGGVSTGPFASLNLGLTVPGPGLADAPERVTRNRAILAAAVGIAWEGFRRGRQTHTTVVARDGPPARDGALEAADGQALSALGAVALVLVADCLPIALAAPGAVAMLHGGWRGLAGGIVEEGVRAVRALTRAEPIVAAIGPGAGGCCYEVGEMVHAEFADLPEARNGNNLDLELVARRRLEAAGVASVHATGLCTMCSDPSLFFSHRRDGAITGRQGGMVWRVPA